VCSLLHCPVCAFLCAGHLLNCLVVPMGQILFEEVAMTALFIVRATVPESDREAFDFWYQNEHLPDAKIAFDASAASRGWSEEDPALHIAIYHFPDVARANAVANSEQLQQMVAEFDRVWQQRVTRTREIVEIKQSI